MSFYQEYLKYKDIDIRHFIEDVSGDRIQRILQKPVLTQSDFLCLLSPAAESFIEEMAQQAHRISVRQFGRVIHLFTPLYLSNYCTNQCLYCGFNASNKIERKQLTLEEVEQEAKAVSATGLKHILILTGDARKIASIDYLKDCLDILRKYFTSISIEIYALETREYEALIEHGVDSLTIYQETYHEQIYDQLHITGPKKDYGYRLDAPERACRAGIRSVNIGSLLGLNDWQYEAFFSGLHADYLQDKYPEVEFSMSLPRMRPHAGSFQPKVITSDKNLVQVMTALRIFLPRVGITISTRENAAFRDNIIKLGVTKMSAGSTTVVGGRTQENKNTGQFDISDHRTVAEMTANIQTLGYQPVFKDWQPI